MEPAEIRRINMITEDAFPFTTTGGATYDVGAYEAALDKALQVSGYSELRKEQSDRRQRGDARQLGIGLSCYVEVTNPFPSQEYGGVEIRSDGSVLVRSGTSPHGQGHDTSWSMLVSEVLGVSLESVTVVTGDTDQVPRGVGTFGSRSLQLGGVAVFGAAREVLEIARRVGSELLEAAPEDLVLSEQGDGLHVVGSPTSHLSWSALAQAGAEAGTPLTAEVDFKAENSTFPFGAHVVVVEVDTETGKVEVQRVVAVDDAGRIVAPLLAEGQVHGGLAQGIAQALMEEVVYDSDGNPLTSNLADYAMISAVELPSFELVHQETPTYLNPLGAKGIGESGTIGSTPAVLNAVLDALTPYGIDYLEMPLTPHRIWSAMSHARADVAAR
jgi:carbon-monoxide dehydrogenase large subunit